jgi:hypothetical protein
VARLVACTSNDVVINNTTVVNVQNINVYRNTSVRNAVVVVNENRFGRGPITGARLSQVDVKNLRPTHAAPQVTAMPASFVPAAGRRPASGGKPEAIGGRDAFVARGANIGRRGEQKAGPPELPCRRRASSGAASTRARCGPGSASLGRSSVERRTPIALSRPRLRSRPWLARRHRRRRGASLR